MNKIICNFRVLLRLELWRAIHYEVMWGRRRKSSQHFALNKKLVWGIGNQPRRPTVVVSADSTNCYDQIVHPVTNNTNKHFGVQLECLLVLSDNMQSIKMFVRISYGVSERFCTTSQDRPFQRAIRGNRSSPQIWLMISVFMLLYLCDSNLVSVHKLQCL